MTPSHAAQVIYFTDVLDEYVMGHLLDYDDKKFANASKEDLKLADKDEVEKKKDKVLRSGRPASAAPLPHFIYGGRGLPPRTLWHGSHVMALARGSHAQELKDSFKDLTKWWKKVVDDSKLTTVKVRQSRS
jgi:heat shock protein beta